MKKLTALYALVLCFAGTGAALAQVNSIEAFNVLQQDGKTVVRVTTKDALKSVPPNFAITSPARIAFDFPNTVNALGHSSQDVGEGVLKSMNLVQGAGRTRMVLHGFQATRRIYVRHRLRRASA